MNCLNKVVELEERKLEPEHIYKNSEYIFEELLKINHLLGNNNNKIIQKYKDNEIKSLNVQIKEKEALYNGKIIISKQIKKRYKKRDLKYMSLWHALAIIEGPERLNNKKGKKIDEIKIKLDSLKNIA